LEIRNPVWHTRCVTWHLFKRPYANYKTRFGVYLDAGPFDPHTHQIPPTLVMYLPKQPTSDLVDLTDRITRTSPFYSAGGGFGDIWRCTLQTGTTQDVVRLLALTTSIHLRYFQVAVKAIRFQSGEVGASQEKVICNVTLSTYSRMEFKGPAT
jgi:hypothetical protein